MELASEIHLLRRVPSMENSRRFLPLVGVLFIVAMVGLLRFSQNVRSVDAVGLSGSGFALGVGFVLLVLGFAGKMKP
jgi:hypothetical protein